jgi:hypothetical protein
MKLFPLSFFAASFVALAGLGGCAAESPDSQPANAEEVADTEDALTASAVNSGYYLVTRMDARKCLSPVCGGFFVKKVNAATTPCADGSKQAECYVSAIQLTGIGLSAREEEDFRMALVGGKALIKARLYKAKFNGTYYGTLKASEGWQGATGSVPDGTFYRAADNGIRCIMAPCPTTTAAELNGSDSHNLISVQLGTTATPASQTALDRAAAALATKEGILVSGTIAVPKCMPQSNCGPFALTSEFYLRVTRHEGKACGGRGGATCNDGQYCSWTPAAICGRADAAGTCAYKPEVCNQLYKPVCGCDGQTYSNACVAAAAGASVSSTGACVAVP